MAAMIRKLSIKLPAFCTIRYLFFFFNIPAIYEAIYLIPILIVRKFKGNKEKLGMFDDYGRKFLSTCVLVIYVQNISSG